MNRFLYQDIVTYQHQSKTAAIIKEYKDVVHLVIRFSFFSDARYMSLSEIEICNLEYETESRGMVTIVEPIRMAIKRNNARSSTDNLVNFRYENFVAMHYHYHYLPHLGQELARTLPQICNWNREGFQGSIPENYLYTYEKEGWLNEVEDMYPPHEYVLDSE